jgi:hypothetical protein
MKPFFSRNIDNKGRLIRGLLALIPAVGSVFGWTQSRALGIVMFGSALFVAFEAFRGWCLLRACGLRTKI